MRINGTSTQIINNTYIENGNKISSGNSLNRNASGTNSPKIGNSSSKGDSYINRLIKRKQDMESRLAKLKENQLERIQSLTDRISEVTHGIREVQDELKTLRANKNTENGSTSSQDDDNAKNSSISSQGDDNTKNSSISSQGDDNAKNSGVSSKDDEDTKNSSISSQDNKDAENSGISSKDDKDTKNSSIDPETEIDSILTKYTDSKETKAALAAVIAKLPSKAEAELVKIYLDLNEELINLTAQLKAFKEKSQKDIDKMGSDIEDLNKKISGYNKDQFTKGNDKEKTSKNATEKNIISAYA